jgi:hypothetical protein
MAQQAAARLKANASSKQAKGPDLDAVRQLYLFADHC